MFDNKDTLMLRVENYTMEFIIRLLNDKIYILNRKNKELEKENLILKSIIRISNDSRCEHLLTQQFHDMHGV